MAHHSRSTLLLAGAAAVLLLLASALGARASGPLTPAHAVVQVSIENFAFSPRTLVIAVGTTAIAQTRPDPRPVFQSLIWLRTSG